MLDVEITQGSFWSGAQIPYWLYMILTILPFTGAIGIDHFALRSPITGLLKLISLVPLFGFWYFYDIAQIFGEHELVKKYGIGIPYFGPTGIGAGIFTKTEGIPDAPRESPRPWLFLLYIIATFSFIALPINKFIIGDYSNGFFQILLYLTIIGIPLAIGQGLYDIINVVFFTKDLFINGPARFPIIPASIPFIGSRYDNSVLGPLPQEEGFFTPFVYLARDATVGLAGIAVDEAGNTIRAASDAAQTTIGVAEQAASAVTGTVAETAKAAEGLAKMVKELPTLSQKIATKLPDTIAEKISTQAVPAMPTVPAIPAMPTVPANLQKGGALLNVPLSTTALLFSVSILAFSGYVFYVFRNTFGKPEESDDPPREPRAVRSASKSGQ